MLQLAARPERALGDDLLGRNQATGAERRPHRDQHRHDGEVAQPALRESVRIELQRTAREEVPH